MNKLQILLLAVVHAAVPGLPVVNVNEDLHGRLVVPGYHQLEGDRNGYVLTPDRVGSSANTDDMRSAELGLKGILETCSVAKPDALYTDGYYKYYMLICEAIHQDDVNFVKLHFTCKLPWTRAVGFAPDLKYESFSYTPNPEASYSIFTCPRGGNLAVARRSEPGYVIAQLSPADQRRVDGMQPVQASGFQRRASPYKSPLPELIPLHSRDQSQGSSRPFPYQSNQGQSQSVRSSGVFYHPSNPGQQDPHYNPSQSSERGGGHPSSRGRETQSSFEGSSGWLHRPPSPTRRNRDGVANNRDRSRSPSRRPRSPRPSTSSSDLVKEEIIEIHDDLEERIRDERKGRSPSPSTSSGNYYRLEASVDSDDVWYF